MSDAGTETNASHHQESESEPTSQHEVGRKRTHSETEDDDSQNQGTSDYSFQTYFPTRFEVIPMEKVNDWKLPSDLAIYMNKHIIIIIIYA